MTEAQKLLSAFNSFSKEQKINVGIRFHRLADAYPHKCYHTAGFTDLWLTAIKDIKTNTDPWTVAAPINPIHTAIARIRARRKAKLAERQRERRIERKY